MEKSSLVEKAKMFSSVEVVEMVSSLTHLTDSEENKQTQSKTLIPAKKIQSFSTKMYLVLGKKLNLK